LILDYFATELIAWAIHRGLVNISRPPGKRALQESLVPQATPT